MPRRNNNSITDFQFAQYNPGVMQFQAFTPQSNLGDFAANQLEKYQAASDKLHEDNRQFAIQLGEAKNKLHKDDETDAWVNGKLQEINDKYNEYVNNGNFREGIDYIRDAAANFALSDEWQGRMQANADYEEARKIMQNRALQGDINQITYERWLEQNPYYYQDKTDENGNVIGKDVWNANWTGVKKGDIAQLFAKGASMVRPDKTTIGTDKMMNNNMVSTMYTVKDVTSTEKVTEKDIDGAVAQMLSGDILAKQQLFQEYEDQKYYFNQLNKKLNSNSLSDEERQQYEDYRALFQVNGVDKQDNNNNEMENFATWYGRNIIKSHFRQDLAYTNYTHTTDLQGGGGAGKTPQAEQRVNGQGEQTPTATGPNTNQNGSTSHKKSLDDVNGASAGSDEAFKRVANQNQNQ